MDQDHLRALLAQLQGELSRGDALDERNRQLLSNVQADIERAVHKSDNVNAGDTAVPLPPGEQAGRQSRLQEAMVSLETSHPQLAAAIEQGMVALSNLGL